MSIEIEPDVSRTGLKIFLALAALLLIGTVVWYFLLRGAVAPVVAAAPATRPPVPVYLVTVVKAPATDRSEERRVGKECRL